MFKNLIFVLILFKSFVSQAQDQTPIATHPFGSDAQYQKQIGAMIQIYEQTNEVKTLDSLVSLSFIYKDWETSINYAKKAIQTNPNAKRYFLLGGAAGFSALEVPLFSSLKFFNIKKSAFEESVRLEPLILSYLRAQVDILLALPSILGGSDDKAQELIQKIKSLNSVEGLLAQGLIYEINDDLYSAKLVYKQLFDFLNQNYTFCSIAFIEDNRRNLSYDLGRIAADFQLNTKWGQFVISYFAKTYGQKDTVPIAWVFFQSARLAKRS